MLKTQYSPGERGREEEEEEAGWRKVCEGKWAAASRRRQVESNVLLQLS